MDEFTKVKNDLMIELNAQYRNLVNFLATLPMPEKFKVHSFQNLDQGIMWAQKGIELLEVSKKVDPSTEVLNNTVEEKIELPESTTVN